MIVSTCLSFFQFINEFYESISAVTEVQRGQGEGKCHCRSKERGIQSSSSHANDADKVTDLCHLAGASGQDTFTSGEVVLESDRRVSAIWELGPRTRDGRVRPYRKASNFFQYFG